MKKIAILGSTGSIGTQTLDVVRANGDLEVVGISAGSNITLLEQQIREFHPKFAAVGDEAKAAELRDRVKGSSCKNRQRHGRHDRACHDAGERNPCDSDRRHDRHPPDGCGDEAQEKTLHWQTKRHW